MLDILTLTPGLTGIGVAKTPDAEEEGAVLLESGGFELLESGGLLLLEDT